MNIYERVYSVMTTDTPLDSLGIDETSVFRSGGVDSPTVRPFVVLKWGPVRPGIGSVSQTNLDIWAYDKGGDYARVIAILKRARLLMLNLEAVGQGTDWFVGVRWAGDSTDLYDQDYDAVAKYGSFTVTASGL